MKTKLIYPFLASIIPAAWIGLAVMSMGTVRRIPEDGERYRASLPLSMAACVVPVAVVAYWMGRDSMLSELRNKLDKVEGEDSNVT